MEIPAAQALKAGGRPLAFLKAKVFILSVPVDCSGVHANRGAIAYDDNGYDPDTVARATPQAILGLGGPSLAALSASGSKPGVPVLLCR
ncbi:hypothetical protein LWC34_12455 [Kibdelosporangium philippinense]|uniref:Uncharacterized protein n=2 Tax=Kibdelosporangium philippinense TaxID=211113 RepID=A0ABS8Z811_9PSEU|nr:hypothetical protein [Kibdelosporangium philippinense]MCE7003632.1 hypothetical protein [Kibdelosporangium philippinense]